MHGKFEDDITWDYAESGDTTSEPSPALVTNDAIRVTNDAPEGQWWVTNLHDSEIRDHQFADHLATRMKIKNGIFSRLIVD